MIAVSSCLLGMAVRYDASHKLFSPLKVLADQQLAIAICPEVLGGMSTPRPAAEIVGGDGFDVWQGSARVMDVSGEDVTDAFIAGAKKALTILKEHHITHVVLKANSPSCSSQTIYQGRFDGSLHAGVGVATALFVKNGITVWDEDHPDLPEILMEWASQSNIG